jgi:hypothetical protein
MDGSGEAVERIVRISMDGAEHVLRIAGNGAKALGELLVSLLREDNRTQGAMQLKSMIKTGKELKVFTLSVDQFARFKADVKDFGVTYCVLRNKNAGRNSLIEIMVKAEDASKIHRIFERNGFGSIDASHLEADVKKSRKEAERAAPEREESAEPISQAYEAPIRKERGEPENPFAEKAAAEKPHRSKDTSEKQAREGRARMPKGTDKKSVRIEIMEMRKARAGKSQTDIDALEYIPGRRKHDKER